MLLALLLAILEKRGGYPMATNDVFVSVAGGLRLSEPALDLPIMVAIVSSLLNKPVDPVTLVVGEVGLSGEVRAITNIERRLTEAAKLGFKTIVLPQSNRTNMAESAEVSSLKIIGVRDLNAALAAVVG